MSHSHKTLEERIAKSIEMLKEDLNTVRAGRANPALLDKVMANFYGVPTPLKNMANITVPDPRTLMITPFDPKSIGDIEKGINVAEIGITPKELTKTTKKMGEDAKIAIRNLRRDANDHLKKAQKDGELTEDDLKKELDKVQKTTDKAVKDIDEIITNIRQAYAEKKVEKKPAAMGDEVIIDFTGKKDGKPFQGGSAKDY